MNLKTKLMYLWHLYKIPKSTIVMGKNCTGTPWIYSHHRDKVIIGNYCSIGPEVVVIPTYGAYTSL